ncbi:16S rRNA (cytosine(1402)-N(4))-methyltransferase RsmH [Neomegalonema sp.]|uniref:16S rRNA (cytosine(1402)-N(4))-methyltransferase RsmH n=1 Tax=Neomegalonema sp. TaxID=2039713 RepID=UPI002639A278|nr:16S rRNA (cytosine(1402)-N(4))-methyltransferase RsmH [Neomegalonema sp.]MDD2868950.1 16S rRNA (cytosine(1402)-N(4))-methyltransferase RsmH [Neomegalonema sp.]
MTSSNRDDPEAAPEAPGAREALEAARLRHDPVLLAEVLAALAPREGARLLDGTFGAGGYARALLEAADCRVLGVDRDPSALEAGRLWAPLYGGRLVLAGGRFGDLDAIAVEEGFAPLDGIALDIGVSSMQIDQAERGFSFMRDGPLDMRMSAEGPSAADVVAEASEEELADIFYHYGEERRSRGIARAVVKARAEAPILTTLRLAGILAAAQPRPKPYEPHPATRCFQALRIHVNDELGELARALSAAERVLAPGGVLAVVTFHSLEDRMVKRFLQLRAEGAARPSRHTPAALGAEEDAPGFELLSRKPVVASEEETARNPRARSAKLRAARRTSAPARPHDPREGALPILTAEGSARARKASGGRRA